MAEQRELCVCLTKAGTRCKNLAGLGGVLCHVHKRAGCDKRAGKVASKPLRRSPSPRRLRGEKPQPATLGTLGAPAQEQLCHELIAAGKFAEAIALARSNRSFYVNCRPIIEEAWEKGPIAPPECELLRVKAGDFFVYAVRCDDLQAVSLNFGHVEHPAFEALFPKVSEVETDVYEGYEKLGRLKGAQLPVGLRPLARRLEIADFIPLWYRRCG